MNKLGWLSEANDSAAKIVAHFGPSQRPIPEDYMFVIEQLYLMFLSGVDYGSSGKAPSMEDLAEVMRVSLEALRKFTGDK